MVDIYVYICICTQMYCIDIYAFLKNHLLFKLGKENMLVHFPYDYHTIQGQKINRGFT